MQPVASLRAISGEDYSVERRASETTVKRSTCHTAVSAPRWSNAQTPLASICFAFVVQHAVQQIVQQVHIKHRRLATNPQHLDSFLYDLLSSVSTTSRSIVEFGRNQSERTCDTAVQSPNDDYSLLFTRATLSAMHVLRNGAAVMRYPAGATNYGVAVAYSRSVYKLRSFTGRRTMALTFQT